MISSDVARWDLVDAGMFGRSGAAAYGDRM